MDATSLVLFPLGKKYQVGICFVDIQHKQLADIISRLHQAMASGKGKEVLNKTLDELVRYTKAHFAAEEKVPESQAYPDFPAHHAEHERLTSAVLEFQQKLMGNQMGLSVGLTDFLKDWLGNHIVGVDMNYAPFLKSRGVV